MPVEPFYLATFSSRDPRRHLKLAVISLLAFFPIAAFLKTLNGQPPRDPTAELFACILGPLFILLFLAHFYLYAINFRSPIRIDEHGILAGRRIIPWSQITSISFSRKSFSSTGFLAYSTHPSRKTFFTLPSDNPLTPEEFATLVTRLRPWIAAHHPNVALLLTR